MVYQYAFLKVILLFVLFFGVLIGPAHGQSPFEFGRTVDIDDWDDGETCNMSEEICLEWDTFAIQQTNVNGIREGFIFNERSQTIVNGLRGSFAEIRLRVRTPDGEPFETPFLFEVTTAGTGDDSEMDATPGTDYIALTNGRGILRYNGDGEPIIGRIFIVDDLITETALEFILFTITQTFEFIGSGEPDNFRVPDRRTLGVIAINDHAEGIMWLCTQREIDFFSNLGPNCIDRSRDSDLAGGRDFGETVEVEEGDILYVMVDINARSTSTDPRDKLEDDTTIDEEGIEVGVAISNPDIRDLRARDDFNLFDLAEGTDDVRPVSTVTSFIFNRSGSAVEAIGNPTSPPGPRQEGIISNRGRFAFEIMHDDIVERHEAFIISLIVRDTAASVVTVAVPDIIVIIRDRDRATVRLREVDAINEDDEEVIVTIELVDSNSTNRAISVEGNVRVTLSLDAGNATLQRTNDAGMIIEEGDYTSPTRSDGTRPNPDPFILDRLPPDPDEAAPDPMNQNQNQNMEDNEPPPNEVIAEIPAEMTEVQIRIPIIDDQLVEGSESFEVRITGISFFLRGGYFPEGRRLTIFGGMRTFAVPANARRHLNISSGIIRFTPGRGP